MALGLAASRASASTLASVAQMLDGDGQKAREVVRRLLAKGWLQRVASGRYVFLPPEWGAEKVEDYDVYVLASASVDEGYVGWWAAASRHGFTTQVPSTVHVATNRQVPPREIQGTPIRYVKLSPKKFFGWEETAASTRSFRISTQAKTVVDCADRPDLCGGPTELARVVARAAEDVDPQPLVDVARANGSVSTCQRLGFLLDLTAPGYLKGKERERLKSMVAHSARSAFGRPNREPGDIGYVADWGLLVHAAEADLMSEAASYPKGFGR